MLIESEHNMAREDRDTSGTEMGFIALSLKFCGKVLAEGKNGENEAVPILVKNQCSQGVATVCCCPPMSARAFETLVSSREEPQRNANYA